MKKTLLFKFIALSLFALLSVGMVNAQVLLVVNFDYASWRLAYANGWTNHGLAGFNNVTTGLSCRTYVFDIGGAANLKRTGRN